MLLLSNIFFKIFIISFAVDASFSRSKCLSVMHCATIDLAFASLNRKLFLSSSFVNDAISTLSVSYTRLSSNRHLTRNFQLLKFSADNGRDTVLNSCLLLKYSFWNYLRLKLWFFISSLHVVTLSIVCYSLSISFSILFLPLLHPLWVHNLMGLINQAQRCKRKSINVFSKLK